MQICVLQKKKKKKKGNFKKKGRENFKKKTALCMEVHFKSSFLLLKTPKTPQTIDGILH
ncbi:hypothetical protein I7I53_07513 [Histoplasma capsulatum var. duboisii H88]|uniref:Uncharacterized protein n=1 Tax=Ajellomyces capsulatus (strain H88) TaxID=544711 RepID=A0A8A1LC83_AJEC8|nr:hypothetical protein I7I53_07513 [Histoplasma capsulatum var. duboisii H88]